MATFFAEKPEELERIAKGILAASADARIFAFYGEMGAGKTTLIRQLLQALGVEDAGSSPTYSLVNEYALPSGEPVYHFDFYRIEDLEEVYDIGYESYFFSGSYCFIEWPEKIGELLPDEAVKFQLNILNEGREIVMEMPG